MGKSSHKRLFYIYGTEASVGVLKELGKDMAEAIGSCEDHSLNAYKQPLIDMVKRLKKEKFSGEELGLNLPNVCFESCLLANEILYQMDKDYNEAYRGRPILAEDYPFFLSHVQYWLEPYLDEVNKKSSIFPIWFINALRQLRDDVVATIKDCEMNDPVQYSLLYLRMMTLFDALSQVDVTSDNGDVSKFYKAVPKIATK